MNGALAPPVLPEGIAALCGTPTVIARQIRAGFAPLSLASLARMADVDMGLPDGSPLWFNQYPRLIRADDPGGLRFENFLVVGDIETLDFERWSVDAWDQVSETWTRTGTSAIDGHLVSRFDPSWTHAELWDSLAWALRGVDQPSAYWGTLTIPNTEDDEDDGEVGIWLEVAPLNLPEARVERINESTQYASHVVNLLVEDFGDARLTTDNYGFDLNAVVQQFYEHFEDTYDSIAVVAADKHIIPEYAAFHQNVRNGISGLGDLAVFDNSSTYGSSGALRSVELYLDGTFTRLSWSHHEIGHQWVDYWDWSEIAGGIERGGANPSSHFPLLFPGGTLTGGVLQENRRVAHVVDGDDNDSAAYVVEGTLPRGCTTRQPSTEWDLSGLKRYRSWSSSRIRSSSETGRKRRNGEPLSKAAPAACISTTSWLDTGRVVVRSRRRPGGARRWWSRGTGCCPLKR